MNVFGELLRISEFRESKAETGVARSRVSLAQAHAAETEAAELLERFVAYSEQRERSLYADLCRRVVKMREIEEVQWNVVELRAGERQRAEELDAARKSVVSASDALEQAKEVLRLATRVREKFLELARSHDEERQRDLQRIEDLEMEEVHLAAADREDREEWEESHGELA